MGSFKVIRDRLALISDSSANEVKVMLVLVQKAQLLRDVCSRFGRNGS